MFSRLSVLSYFIALFPFYSFASGILPETSVVVVEESEGEAVMNLKNTDNTPLLLLTTIKNIPQDPEGLLQVSPPAIRVDGGKTQTVRFFLTNKSLLKTERLKRVVFEGVPPKAKGANTVQVNISQNLPVIIRPAGLAKNYAPWKLLEWSYLSSTLQVKNNSPYVVRMAQTVQTRPDNTTWDLQRTYVLPGESLQLEPQSPPPASAPQLVRISPATTWGYTVETWDAPLSAK